MTIFELVDVPSNNLPHIDQFTYYSVDLENQSLYLPFKDEEAHEFFKENDGVGVGYRFRSLPGAFFQDISETAIPVATSSGIPNRHLVAKSPFSFPEVEVSLEDENMVSMGVSNQQSGLPAGEELRVSLPLEDVQVEALEERDSRETPTLVTQTRQVKPTVRVRNFGTLSVKIPE